MPKLGNKPQHLTWIREHLDYPHKNYCLMWPFPHREGIYASFILLGKKHYVHRYICTIIHGKPPSKDHQASHSCNRAHEGCVNPNHLRWKTRSANSLEAGWKGRLRRKLNITQVTEIKSLKGIEHISITAKRFGVRPCTVQDIQEGRTWKSTFTLSTGQGK